MANLVTITVRVNNEASSGLARIGSASNKVFTAMRKRATEAVTAVAKMGLTIANVAATALSAAPLFTPVITNIVKFGKELYSVAPAAAAFAVAGGIVAGTLKLIFADGSAMRGVLQPLADGIKLAGNNASIAASRGLAPLVAGFKNAIWPQVNHTMVQIGNSVNTVAKNLLTWGQSSEGVKSLNSILEHTWEAFDNILPAVSRVVIAFLNLIGRVMDVSANLGANGLAGILNLVANHLDRIDAKTVADNLAKLEGQAVKVWQAFQTMVTWVHQAIDAYIQFRPQINAISDVLAILAIAFGGPEAAIAGAIGLLIRHFGDLKTAYAAVKTEIQNSPQFAALGAVITGFWAETQPKLEAWWQEFKLNIEPALKNVANTLETKVVPAVTNLIQNGLIPLAHQLEGPVGQAIIIFAVSYLAYLNTELRALAWTINNVVVPILQYWTFQFKIMEGVVNGVISSIRTLIGWIGKIPGAGSFASGIKSAVGGIAHDLGFAHGGVVSGAATGGPRSGLIKVGEHGEELVQLPGGSRVYSNADSSRALSTPSQSSGGTVHLTIDSSGNPPDDLLLEWLRRVVRVNGGDVQFVLGRS